MIRIPEPYRETFLSNFDRAMKHGVTREDYRDSLHRVRDIQYCDTIQWWSALGVVVAEATYQWRQEKANGADQEG